MVCNDLLISLAIIDYLYILVNPEIQENDLDSLKRAAYASLAVCLLLFYPNQRALSHKNSLGVYKVIVFGKHYYCENKMTIIIMIFKIYIHVLHFFQRIGSYKLNPRLVSIKQI